MFVNIPESIVRQYPMLLSGGRWGTIDLTYDENEVHGKKIRPFKITAFTPFQVSVINLLHFEMQSTKGSGRIVPLGSIQRVMRESIEAAAQYIKAKSGDLDINSEWRSNYDIAILATFMGIPKEGPSAGISLVTGIVSALKGIPVRNDLAMTGEITIMGKVLPVGGIQQKIKAAYDAEIKEVIIPADNLQEAEGLPDYIKNEVKITPVRDISEVLKAALITNETNDN
jgi:ATP-dependent Lon protease